MATLATHPRPAAGASSATRRFLAAVLTVLLTGTVLAGTAASAYAEDGYRYWNYYHLEDGAWAFSMKGAGEFRPADGAVEGYRFGTSTTEQTVEPRADLAEVTFDAVCGASTAAAGEKRVAFVIDYGTEADAEGADVPEPTTVCAVVERSATSQQALESVVDVRNEDGLICALDGYPASGCGVPVADATVPADETIVAFTLPGSADEGAATEPAAAESSADEGSGPWVGLAAIVVVAVLLGLGALLMSRRRQAA